MYFTAYVLRDGLYVGGTPDVREVLLYNGRRVLVRGPGMYTSGNHHINPGDLIKFYCGHNGANKIDFDADQKPGTFYQLSYDWSNRITDEHTIRTFMMGARILEPRTHLKTWFCRVLKKLLLPFVKLRSSVT